MTHPELVDWIKRYLADTLKLDIAQIEPSLPFDDYGLGSIEAIELMGALGDLLDRDLDPNSIYDHPTVDELSRHLIGDDSR